MMEHGNTTHGNAKRGRKTGAYLTWEAMLRRCTLPSQDNYPDYGGRGIRVCARWNSFESFLADMGDKPPGMTVERNDSNGNYEPGNCRWATPSEQARNTRRSRRMTMGDQTFTIVEWSERTGIPSSAIRSRIDKLGWDTATALTTPLVPRETSIKRASAAQPAAPISDYISALREGESCAAIAARFGVSASGVVKALIRHGDAVGNYTQTTEARRARAQLRQKSPHKEGLADKKKATG